MDELHRERERERERERKRERKRDGDKHLTQSRPFIWNMSKSWQSTVGSIFCLTLHKKSGYVWMCIDEFICMYVYVCPCMYVSMCSINMWQKTFFVINWKMEWRIYWTKMVENQCCLFRHLFILCTYFTLPWYSWKLNKW